MKGWLTSAGSLTLLATMSEASSRRGVKWELIASMIGGLLFVYVGSTGPVIAYCNAHDKFHDNRVEEAVVRIYYPLIVLADACRPIGRFFNGYSIWCEKMFFRSDQGK